LGWRRVARFGLFALLASMSCSRYEGVIQKGLGDGITCSLGEERLGCKIAE